MSGRRAQRFVVPMWQVSSCATSTRYTVLRCTIRSSPAFTGHYGFVTSQEIHPPDATPFSYVTSVRRSDTRHRRRESPAMFGFHRLNMAQTQVRYRSAVPQYSSSLFRPWESRHEGVPFPKSKRRYREGYLQGVHRSVGLLTFRKRSHWTTLEALTGPHLWGQTHRQFLARLEVRIES
jgi:hypothetical protein